MDVYTLNELKEMAENEVYRILDEIRDKYPSKFIPSVIIRWSNRMTSTAGTASIKKNAPIITLSTKLLEINGLAFVERTPGHEACHIADYYIYGNFAHKRTWKGLMRLVGLQPDRCHNYKTPEAKRTGRRTKHRYIVNGTEVLLGAIRHRRLQSGQVIAYCVASTGDRILPEHYTGETA